jgi:hypothetical protein
MIHTVYDRKTHSTKTEMLIFLVPITENLHETHCVRSRGRWCAFEQKTKRKLPLILYSRMILQSFHFLCAFLMASTAAAGNDTIFSPKARCSLAYLRSGFDINDFAHYPDFFRNDSVVQLAQAGIYQGAHDIEEYIKFVYAAFSPYLAQDDPEKTQIRVKILGYHNGQCEYLSINKFGIFFDPSTTDYLSPVEHVNMVKLYLNLDQGYVTRLNVFFPADFLRLFFGVALNSDNTRRYICEQVIAGSCSGILNATADCEATLETLPPADGELNYVDGNSQGCRALHAAFAATNPVMHCAHLSFTPLADPRGRFKCQTSKKTPPSDLFTEEELALYRKFARRHGIDPDLGHD